MPLIALILAVFLRLMPGFLRINNAYQLILFSVNSINEVNNILFDKDYKNEIYEKQNINFKSSELNKIELKNISFEYHEGKKKILDKINLKLETGEIIGISGKSGSGKTTIATTLASFYASIGKSVALVDLDSQESSISWLKLRSSAKPPITGIKGYGEKVRRGIDYKIIDAPAGLQGGALTKVLNMAESVIIPVLPSPIDMRAASEFIKNIKKHSRVVKKKSKIALVANRGRDYTNIYS